MLRILFEIKKNTFFLKKKMPWWTISVPLTSHSSRVAASRNLYLSFSSNLWLFWAFFSMLVIFGSCLGFFQYPSLHLHLKKKNLSFTSWLSFPLAGDKREALLMEKLLLSDLWTQSERIRCSPALEVLFLVWRREESRCFGDSCTASGLEKQKWKTRQLLQGAEFTPSLCLHSLAFLDNKQAGACWLNCSGYCTRSCRLMERRQGASFSLRTVGLTPLV